MFETALEEQDLADVELLGGIDPFALRDRLLIRHLRGRACFDIGEAMKCWDGSLEITEGRHGGLELTTGPSLANLKLTTAYEFERKLSYSCGVCDSVAPVLVFDDARIHVWEMRPQLLAGLWKHVETVFIPTKRPFIASNKVTDDPECGCASASPPTGGPDDHISLAIEETITRLISSTSLTPSQVEEERPDPSRTASNALMAVQGAIAPFQADRPERVGLMDIRDQVVWFTEEDDSPLPAAVLLSTDCNAALRGRLAVVADDSDFPLLAVTPGRNASWSRMSLAIERPDRGLVPYEDWETAVASDRVSVAWASVDLSDFPAGSAGEITLELFDHRDQLIAQPLTEAFVIVTEPAFADEALATPERV